MNKVMISATLGLAISGAARADCVYTGAKRAYLECILGEISAVAGDVAGLTSDLLGLSGTVAQAQSDLTDLDGRVGALEGATASLGADLGDLSGAVSTLTTASLDTQADVSALQSGVAANAADIADLQAAQLESAALSTVFSGRMVYYPFDDAVGSYTYDLSSFGQTAELRGGVNFVSTAKVGGRALEFNGTNGHLLIADHPVQRSYYRGLTLMAWIRPTASMPANGMIISKHFTNGSRAWDIRVGANAEVRFLVSDDTPWNGSSGNNAYTAATAANAAPLNTWVHVAGTWDRAAGLMTVYVDGAPASTLSVPANLGINTTTVPMMVGAYNDNATGTAPRAFFAGQIDDVQVYNRALGASEIAAYYEVTR